MGKMSLYWLLYLSKARRIVLLIPTLTVASLLLKKDFMNQAIELTLEQEFSLRRFADQVQEMSREQAQEFLIEQYRLMMIQEKMYQALIKHEWQMDITSLQKEE